MINMEKKITIQKYINISLEHVEKTDIAVHAYISFLTRVLSIVGSIDISYMCGPFKLVISIKASHC